ncbi:MAG: hypothetical protein ACT4P6_15135 [Gemmatimonadaceae bacterium]
MREVGQWTAKYGASIYGTRKGPVPPRSWGATTQRGDTVFVHVLDWPDAVLALPALGGPVLSAAMLDGGAAVKFSQSDAGVTLTLPAPASDALDRVVVLRLAKRS